MKSPLLLLLSLFSLYVLAQGTVLRVEPGNVVKEVVVDDLDKDYQDITNVTVTNVSGRTIQLVQEQLVGSKPRAWKYGTFSRRSRTAPYVLSEDDGHGDSPVRLAPGESASFYIVLQPEGISGEGTIEVRFSDLTVPGNILATSTFATKVIRRPRVNAATPPSLPLSTAAYEAAAANRPVPTDVRLYPNPAYERFFVEAPPGVKLGKIEVANTLGKRLRTFDRPMGKDGYEIQDLPDGLYLVSIYDSQGKKLKTLRLLHRRFGA